MRRRKTAIFFLVLGISLTVLTVALNVGWILLNLREVVLLILGIVVFALIITGLILNTIFLFREIRRNEQHDAFINSVTHELKTPIASIRLYLDTLRSRDVPEEKRMEFYDVMRADADRLLHTVDQVLRAGRAREKLGSIAADVDLKKLLEESVAIIRTQRHLDPSVIDLHLPEDQLIVLGDVDQLRTAFMNILENGIKYSGPDPHIDIRTKILAMNKRVDIYFRDNGVGLDEPDLKRIFRRFYRVPDSEPKAPGTGLGLYIVNSLIESHGGSVHAESDGRGKGTTFVVRLPIQ